MNKKIRRLMSLMKIFSLAHTRGCAGLEGVKCRDANFYIS